MKRLVVRLRRSGPRAEFPGEIAGASLKRDGPDQHRAGGPGIPRRNRRGLIEAAQLEAYALAGGQIPRRNRRGLIEATAEAPPPFDAAPQFPGEIAGASLKRRHLGHHGRLTMGIPRRNRRGLIEAG